ncbi:MAG: hypothetical protein P4L22_03260 [Candidatus Babeliales bacterium]|nr:hypothetical protein [Candidatus Babeliales bacterium]
MKIKSLMLSLLVAGSFVSSANAGIKEQILENCTQKNAGLGLVSAIIAYCIVPKNWIAEGFEHSYKYDSSKEEYMDDYGQILPRKMYPLHRMQQEGKAKLTTLSLRAVAFFAAYKLLQKVLC